VVEAHYKKDDLLNCWNNSSDISSYHAEFHEVHGTVGAGQGNGMGTAWARHAIFESVFTVCFCNRKQQQQTSYCHVFLLIPFLGEAFIGNTIIIPGINYRTTV
jgi:hypothetical protein